MCVSVQVSGGHQGVRGDRRTIPRWRLLPPVFAVPGGASSEFSFVQVLEVVRAFLFDIISQPGWGRNCRGSAAERGEVPGCAGRGRERGGCPAVRLYPSRSPSKRTTPCAFVQAAAGPLAPAEPGLESRPAVRMSWGGWRSWRAELLQPWTHLRL